ncbi:MAG TPA: hypothetical protein IAC34_04515 [Candidatus Coprenecus stercoripullorum]|nr:hypothetical protein [Candidatus Coprenecus stercoripullorum]
MMYRLLLAIVILLPFMPPACFGKGRKADTLSPISSIKGADIILYDLYRQNKGEEDGPAYAMMFLDRVDTTSMDLRIAEIWDYVADYYEKEEYRFTDAIKALEKSLKIYGYNSETLKYGRTEYRLATLYMKKELYHRTLDYVMRASKIFSDEQDIPGLLDCYNLLGVVYYVCREYEESGAYFDKYAEGARKLNDTSRIVAAINNSALLSNTLKDTVKTSKLIQESINLCSQQKDTVRLGKVYLNVFETYISMGDIEKAEECLEMAKRYITSREDIGTYYMKSGIFEAYRSNREEAITMLNKALEYFDKGELDKKKQFCLRQLHRLYAEGEDWENAYKSLDRFYMIDMNDNSEEMLLELFHYQSEMEIQASIEQAHQRQNRQRLIFVSGMWLLLLAAFSLVMTIKRKRLEIKQRETELASQEEILEMKKLKQYHIDRITEEVINRLTTLRKEIKEATIRSRINQICKDIASTKNEEHWKEVSQYIPEYSGSFYQNLIKAFPNLTINERRLCTLLNRNLTTKEISEITKQSLQSINTARGRLRGKLGITGNDISLQEFLSKFN